MKTFADLHTWVLKNKGAEAAEALTKAWRGSPPPEESEAPSLAALLLKGFVFAKQPAPFDSDYWYALADELEAYEALSDRWTISATFNGTTGELSGTGKVSFLQTLVRLVVEATKEAEEANQ